MVVDTNIVLDWLVFEDPATAGLRDALTCGQHVWLATVAMREELRRVLDYPQILRRLQVRQLSAAMVLERWDAQTLLVAEAPRAPYRCKDSDDQKFIDLAVAHGATLLSKDKAVLSMARRLARLGVRVSRGSPLPQDRVALHSQPQPLESHA